MRPSPCVHATFIRLKGVTQGKLRPDLIAVALYLGIGEHWNRKLA
jgi:hypothetical protein